MKYLIAVSLIWAFSFGLVGSTLTGINPMLVAALRLGLALLVFLPLLRPREIGKKDTLKLAGCGALQFGLMYICYIQAYQYIPSHLVALFSILTPLYVIAVGEIKNGKINSRFLLSGLLSVAGAAVIKAKTGDAESLWTGFLLMQIAGISFACGQVYYKGWKLQHPGIKDHHIFAYLYAGGFLLASLASLITVDWQTIDISTQQWLTLIYLGVVASGIGFFLWNKGTTKVSHGTLAVCNNLLIPLGMAVSLFVFGEVSTLTSESVLRLILGGSLIFAAIFWAERVSPQCPEES